MGPICDLITKLNLAGLNHC